MRTLFAPIILMSLALPAAAQTPVREVAVEVDTAALNPSITAFWTDIPTDLETAILLLVVDRMADTGVRISIDIDEASLASGLENVTNIAETRLSGRVFISSEVDNALFKTYDLTVTMQQSLPDLQPGDVVVDLTTPDQSYKALVDAFAAEVVNRL